MAKQFKIGTLFNGVDNLSRTTKVIAKNFGLVTRAAVGTNRAIKSVANSSKRMGQNLRSASLAGVIGLTAILAPAVAFSDQINELEAVSQSTTTQMAAMTSQAKELGSTTRFSATEAAAAQTFLARAGFETNQILAATPDVLNLAAASNMELARTADIASNIMGAFKIEATDMARVADTLAATTASANVDLEQLAETMKIAAPIANKFGLSLEETGAAAGLLGNIGIQGSLAGTALKTLFTSLAAPGSKARKTLKGIGVDALNANKELKPFNVILAEMSKGLERLPGAKKIEALNAIFGLRGLAGGAELIDQASLGNLDKLSEKLLNVEGRAKSMAETMNKGPGGALRKLKSAAEGLALSIGDSGLTGQFTNMVEKLTEFTSQLSQSETKTLANVAVLLTLLAVLAPIFFAISAVLSVIAPLASGLIFIGGIIGAVLIPLIKRLALNFVILALVNPFAAIIIAVVAVIAVLGLLFVFWEDIVSAVSIGIEKMIGFFSPLIEMISSIGGIGKLFGETVLGIGKEETPTDEETGEPVSAPGQLAANRTNSAATARANVEFTGTPDKGVVISNASGDEINPELGVTATAGF